MILCVFSISNDILFRRTLDDERNGALHFHGPGSIRNRILFCPPTILAKMGPEYLNINKHSFLSIFIYSPRLQVLFYLVRIKCKIIFFHFKKPGPGIFAKFHLLDGFFDELGFYSFLALNAIFDGFF